VLSNGENVEPQPIEDAIVGTSALVDQAMLVGQDQNYLSAFIVVNPAELARRGNKTLCALLALSLSLSVKESDAGGQLLHFFQ
jgi:long-subunit acyl-CoA synthetase (AMP-forming)